MTNDPSYEEQLALLAKMDFNHPGQDTPVPGNISATDRFQRAAYFSKFFPEPKDMQEAFATIMAAIRGVSVPFGTPYNKLGDGFPVYKDRKSTRLNSSHVSESRMPSSA